MKFVEYTPRVRTLPGHRACVISYQIVNTEPVNFNEYLSILLFYYKNKKRYSAELKDTTAISSKLESRKAKPGRTY
jgi:hypothetical protein